VLDDLNQVLQRRAAAAHPRDEEAGHHDRGSGSAGQEAELVAEDQIVTERDRDHERGDPDDPRERTLLVRLQRDETLRERERNDEGRRRERQQEHVAVAEIPLADEQLLAGPGSDERGGDRPAYAQHEHYGDQSAHADPEVVVLALTRERGE